MHSPKRIVGHIDCGIGLGACRTPRHARTRDITRRIDMSIGTILLIIVVLLLIGAIPTWPYSRSWGYGPTGGLGLVVVIVVVLLLLGRI